EQYRRALGIREKLVADYPGIPVYRTDLGGSYVNLGLLIRDRGKSADSLDWFARAIDKLAPIVTQEEPGLANARLYLRNAHLGRAKAFVYLSRYAEAVKDLDQAVALASPEVQPLFRAERAAALGKAGRVAEAVAEVAELTKSAAWGAKQWFD